MSWILFETTESVIEVLWDVALAVFVVRIALVYAALNLLTAALALAAAPYLTRILEPALAKLGATELPLLLGGQLPLLVLLLLGSAGWARCLVVYHEIPRVRGFRLAIGVVAAAVVALVGEVVEVMGWGGKPVGGAVLGGLLCACALMPVGEMVLEGFGKGGEER
ncbi:hypothetical protein B0T25DRAFT_558973 [Lasiosphaeria hispida]|uniref:Uncharacterized protein n=1 Tax=Lasiosphaeria hispida TaxID=260671 RepID=A0AAJ0H6X1_9PEZI|nr:hypothetical protein B0T25DRAFT_558973 [Lasiosphaeria hispida]